MEQEIINSNKQAESETQGKLCNVTTSHLVEEISTLNIYWQAYSYPIIYTINLTIVFDELKNMIKKWFFKKIDHTSIYQNKINETI